MPPKPVSHISDCKEITNHLIDLNEAVLYHDAGVWQNCIYKPPGFSIMVQPLYAGPVLKTANQHLGSNPS